MRSSTLAIYNPPPDDRAVVTLTTHFALQVDGIDAEYARLKAGGMTFVGDPVDFGVASAIYGRDPFGNVIELYEIRDERIAQLER
jgi:glyoxylase I family protein